MPHHRLTDRANANRSAARTGSATSWVTGEFGWLSQAMATADADTSKPVVRKPRLAISSTSEKPRLSEG